MKRHRCGRRSADGFLYCGLKIGIQPQQFCVVVAFCHLPLTPAVRQQPRLLPKRYDPTRPAFDRFLVRSPRYPIVTGKGDQFIQVGVSVVPLFHQ